MRLRPPAGVTVIAAACLLFAGLMALAAVFVLTAPGASRALDLPSAPGVGRRILSASLFAVAAAFPAALAYGLFQLREWGRRLPLVGFVLAAIGRIRDLLTGEYVAFNVATVVIAVLGAT